MKVLVFLGLVVAAAPLGCSEKSSTDSELVAALASASSQGQLRPPPPMLANPGPLLAVLAGQGLGPIRIGANVSQVERLMQRPCEARSENLCRYATRGVDFHLVGGITQWIHVQRKGRPAGQNAAGENVEFGYFYGIIPPDLRLGMTPEAIREQLGKPNRTEKVAEPNPQNMVWRHYYAGLVLEYDYWPETRKLILGGIRVARDANAVAPSVGDAGASAADAGAPVEVTPPAADAGARPPRHASDAGVPRVREPEPR